MRSFYRVLDHASPGTAALYKDFRRFGWDGVVRYIASPESIYDWKRISLPEVRAIHDAGLSLYLVFQNGANGAAYFNAARGKLDGQHAREAAAAMGYPRSLPIYFAVDYDSPGGELLPYFNGVYEGMLHADKRPAHPVGMYGGRTALTYAQRNYPGIEHYWQTYAWSGGVRLPNCDGYQYDNGKTVAGHNVDLNEFLIEGWWLAP